MDVSHSNPNPKAIQLAQRYAMALKRREINYKNIILYGSQARGTADFESDYDLLVIIDEIGPQTREAIVDEAYNLSLEEDAVIIAIPCTVKEFNSPLFQADNFYRNIKNDGVVIS